MIDGWHWFSTRRMTVAVRVCDGLVTESPPITRKFLGQPIRNLYGWLGRQPGFRAERLA